MAHRPEFKLHHAYSVRPLSSTALAKPSETKIKSHRQLREIMYRLLNNEWSALSYIAFELQ